MPTHYPIHLLMENLETYKPASIKMRNQTNIYRRHHLYSNNYSKSFHAHVRFHKVHSNSRSAMFDTYFFVEFQTTSCCQVKKLMISCVEPLSSSMIVLQTVNNRVGSCKQYWEQKGFKLKKSRKANFSFTNRFVKMVNTYIVHN